VFEFKLPDLGEGIHEGEILKWYISVGESIKEDEPLVEIETDKAAVTIPSPRGGSIIALNGKIGDIINVGNVITVIDDGSGESVSVTEKVDQQPEKPSKKVTKSEAACPIIVEALADGHPVPAAPATRRLARELGIDINTIPATGPAGRVTPDDVKAFAEGGVAPVSDSTVDRVESGKIAETEFAAHASTAIPFLDIDPLPDFSKEGTVEIEKLRSIRRKVAHRMTTSKVLVPHVVHMDEADITLLDNFRKAEKVRREGQPGGNLTILAFIIKAITVGLKEYPMFNASLDPFKEEIIYKKYYNIGIAVDSDRGLIVPVIKGADNLSIMEISRQIESLAERARTGDINVSELNGGTFTITNVGALGGTGMTAAINYPEAAILGMGRAQDKPVVRNGEIVIRKMLPLSMSFDHRIADGANAARMITGLIERISDPNRLLMEI